MASRLVITEDRASSALISLAQSISLAEAFPKATARTVLALSRATRAALVASEKEIALAYLTDLGVVLAGEEGIYVEAVKRKVSTLVSAMTWKPVAS